MSRAAMLAAAWTLLALASGCGGGGDDGDDDRGGRDHPVDSLVARLPGDARAVAAMDLAQAKRTLGVKADLDPAGYRGRVASFGTPVARFDDAMLKVLFYFYEPLSTPARKAIDHARVTAAVGAELRDGNRVVILATPQPAEEIEEGLERAGLRRSGSAYVVDKPAALNRLSAVAVQDGLVVLASGPDIAAGVLARTQPDRRLDAVRAELREVRGALRLVRVHEPDDLLARGAPCVRMVAGGAIVALLRADEDLRVTVTGEPDPDRVILGTGAQRDDILTESYEIVSKRVDGDTLVLDVGLRKDALDSANTAAIADGRVRAREVYRCPAGAVPPPPPPPPPPPQQPQVTGTVYERVIEAYIAGRSSASVRVSCPARPRFVPNSKIRCTGTRRDGGKLYHYRIVVNVGRRGVDSIDITSPDDKTGQVIPSEA